MSDTYIPYNGEMPSTETCGKYFLCEMCTDRIEEAMGRDIEGMDWDVVEAFIRDNKFSICGREIKVG
jgi:hypothetical protein